MNPLSDQWKRICKIISLRYIIYKHYFSSMDVQITDYHLFIAVLMTYIFSSNQALYPMKPLAIELADASADITG